MATTAKRYTADDLLHMPGDEPWELWDGELRKVPGAGGAGERYRRLDLSLVNHFVRPRRLGIVTAATRATMRSPATRTRSWRRTWGLSGWERLPGQNPKGYMPGAAGYGGRGRLSH